MSNEVPEFKFALREDLKNNPEFLPTKSNPTDTGFDVRCADPDGIILKPFEYYKISLGFRIFAPEGWWLDLHPRSSSFFKKHLSALYGVIDETFTLEAAFLATYLPANVWIPVWDMTDFPEKKRVNFYKQQGNFLNNPQHIIHVDDAPRIEFGERIGQLIPVRRQEMSVSEISNEEFEELVQARGGRDGFGSTGNK